MKGQSRRMWIVLLAIAIGSGACGDTALSTDDYVVAIEDSTQAYIAEAQDLSLDFHATVEDEVAQIAASDVADPLALATEATVRELSLYLALLEDAMGRYGDALDRVKPPAALASAHIAYSDAVAAVHVSMPATREQIRDAEDLTSLQTLLAGSAFQDGQHRWRATCESLEEAIRAEGQGADLGCAPSDL